MRVMYQIEMTKKRLMKVSKQCKIQKDGGVGGLQKEAVFCRRSRRWACNCWIERRKTRLRLEKYLNTRCGGEKLSGNSQDRGGLDVGGEGAVRGAEVWG